MTMILAGQFDEASPGEHSGGGGGGGGGELLDI